MDSDGNLISGYLDKVRYYKNGKPVSGNIYDNGTYGFEDGYPLIGLNRVDGYLRYYNSQGRMYRDTVVGNSSVGYYYTDPDGICIESEEMRLAAEFIEKYCKGETMKEKMKYAFLYMAEKANHPWFRALKLDSINLGTSRLMATPTGRFINKYNMTISKELADYE